MPTPSQLTFLLTLLLAFMTLPTTKGFSVAVVGGGITGAVAAEALSRHFPSVLVFDQGRRGPGGRASHRSVDSQTQEVVVDDIKQKQGTFEFDHGCQFFRADTDRMKELVRTWRQKDWVAPWNGRFGSISVGETAAKADDKVVDFFGLPQRKDEPVYIGVGGMHQLPTQILDNSKAIFEGGTRVTNVQKNDSTGQWEVWGVSGTPAYHDTKETDATKNADGSSILATVDAVLMTDISSASESWHRASAGIPDELRNQVPKRPRVPLFSCMVALDKPVCDLVPYDGFTVSSASSPLWFAARSQSKPGFIQSDEGTTDYECWTLVSTPTYACQQISETTLRNPVTGAFRPQENSYLNTVPGPQLWDAFLSAIRPYTNDAPKPIYLQAQRWGSGLPAPHMAKEVQDICGNIFTSDLPDSLVYPRIEGDGDDDRDFVHDDDLQLFYAGDFCSSRSPGFEASAVSGLDVAEYMIQTLLKDQDET